MARSERETPVLRPEEPEVVVPASARAVEEPKPLVIRMPIDVRGASLTVLGVATGLLVLSTPQSVLIPIVLGMLISYALAPFVTALARYRVPRPLGAATSVALIIATLATGVYTLSDEVIAIVGNVPVAAQRIRQRLSDGRKDRDSALRQVQRAAQEIEKTAQEATEPATAQTTPVRPGGIQRVQVVEPAFKATDYIWIGGAGFVGFVGQFAVILFLVYFFLVTGDLYKRKLVKIAGPQLWQKKLTVADPRRNQPADRELHPRAGADQRAGRRGDRRRALVLRAGAVHHLGTARGDLQLDSVSRSGHRHRRPRRRRLHPVRRRAEDGDTSAGPRSRSPASRASC